MAKRGSGVSAGGAGAAAAAPILETGVTHTITTGDNAPVRGRPTSYTPAIADEICMRLAGGESLKGICRDDHMPHDATVRGWVLEDREGFSTRYARARELQAEGWADELVDIADDGRNDYVERHRDGDTVTELNAEHIQRSRLRVDTRKWVLSKVLRRTYGDRSEVDLNLRKSPDEMSDAELNAAIAAASKTGKPDGH